MRKSLYVASAMTAALALAGCGGTANVAQSATEKCYGVAQAGKNDCATGAHSCKGQALATRSLGDFIELPAGMCEKLTGSTLTG